MVIPSLPGCPRAPADYSGTVEFFLFVVSGEGVIRPHRSGL